MKKHILNRPMFRQVKSPAYGTGIATNLVSDEERQRYNYGGRVGLYRGADTYGLEYGKIPARAFENISGITEKIYTGDEKPPMNWWDVYSTGGQEYKYQIPEGQEDAGEIVDRRIIYQQPKSEREKLQEKIDADFESEGGDSEVFTKAQIKAAKEDLPPLPGDDTKEDLSLNKVMGDSNELDIASLVDKYYDKKKALGEGQLGLAGAAIKAGFQKPSDAAGTVGDALGKFGTTIAADEKALKKAAMTGEMYNQIYKEREKEKGKQARLTKNEAAKLQKEKTGDPWTDFQGFAALTKGADTFSALEYATGKRPRGELRRDPKKGTILGGEGARPGDIYLFEGQVVVTDENGNLLIENAMSIGDYLKSVTPEKA